MCNLMTHRFLNKRKGLQYLCVWWRKESLINQMRILSNLRKKIPTKKGSWWLFGSNLKREPGSRCWTEASHTSLASGKSLHGTFCLHWICPVSMARPEQTGWELSHQRWADLQHWGHIAPGLLHSCAVSQSSCLHWIKSPPSPHPKLGIPVVLNWCQGPLVDN